MVADISFHLALMAFAAGLSANFQLGYLASALSGPYKQIEGYINSSLTEWSSDATPPSEEAIKHINSALNISNVIAGRRWTTFSKRLKSKIFPEVNSQFKIVSLYYIIRFRTPKTAMIMF